MATSTAELRDLREQLEDALAALRQEEKESERLRQERDAAEDRRDVAEDRVETLETALERADDAIAELIAAVESLALEEPGPDAPLHAIMAYRALRRAMSDAQPGSLFRERDRRGRVYG